MGGPWTTIRRRGGMLTAGFALVAAVMLASCGGSGPAPTSSASVSPTPTASGSAPRGYTLSTREARAVATTVRETEDHFPDSVLEVGGYIVEFTTGSATLGVYVDARRGDAEPARRSWGWMYRAPLENVPPYEDLWPVSAGEHWALTVAHRKADVWSAGRPPRDGQPARIAGHAIVAYVVSIADDDRGWRSFLVDARGRLLGSMGGGSILE